MKILEINITNFLGLRRLAVTLGSPILLVAGQNGQGKSSLAEAIRLALCAESVRVAQKKDYGAMVTEGTKAAQIHIGIDSGIVASVSISASGSVRDSTQDAAPLSPALPYVLDAQRFASLPEDERRRFLFGLMGVKLSSEEITERIITQRQCNTDKVRAIAPLFRAGFAGAEKEASKRATEARGAWKSVAGENYGEVKAAKWRADPGDWQTDDATVLHKLDGEIAAFEAKLQDAHRRLGAAQEQAAQVQKRADAAANLRETAKAFGHHQDLVNRAEAQLADCRAVLDRARAAAGSAPPPKPKTYACPACGVELVHQPDGRLAEYQSPAPVAHDPEAAGRLPGLAKAVQTAEAVLARHVANRDAADDAAKQLKGVEAATEAAGPADDAGPIKETIASLAASIAAAKERQRVLKAAHDQFEAADKRTKEARKHHQDAQDWVAIAGALAPDGIPGDMLAEALGPINKRLAQSAVDTDWMQVRIGADMAVTANGRRYNMLSKSEQFRSDAMIAEAIAHLSGLKLLVLDAFDILLGDARSQFLGWLDLLARECDIDCAIVMGTLREAPAGLPSTFQVVQIERGQAVLPRKIEEVAA